jgi:toxin FitB
VILLDTNVLSALMRTEPDAEVVTWLDGLPPESVWTTSTTVFEVRMGLELLDAGKRRRRLEEAFGKMLEEDFEGRIAVFDRSSAEAAARAAAGRRRAGRPVDFRDVEIAGIALARKAALATGNVRHFEGLGVEFVDPWAST